MAPEDAAGAALLGARNTANLLSEVPIDTPRDVLIGVINQLIRDRNTGTLDRSYAIGSLYFNASVNTDPAILMGFGVWERFGKGRMLVSLDETQTEFDTLGETGGQKTVQAHEHMFGGDDGMSVNGYSTISNFAYDATSSASGGGGNYYTKNLYNSAGTAITGGTNNMNPYIVVYIWRRTA